MDLSPATHQRDAVSAALPRRFEHLRLQTAKRMDG